MNSLSLGGRYKGKGEGDGALNQSAYSDSKPPLDAEQSTNRIPIQHHMPGISVEPTRAFRPYVQWSK